MFKLIRRVRVPLRMFGADQPLKWDKSVQYVNLIYMSWRFAEKRARFFRKVRMLLGRDVRENYTSFSVYLLHRSVS